MGKNRRHTINAKTNVVCITFLNTLYKLENSTPIHKWIVRTYTHNTIDTIALCCFNKTVKNIALRTSINKFSSL